MIHRAQNTIRDILPKNAFVRGASVLVDGTAGAQLISALAVPLLTRLYGPEDIGPMAVYVSLLAINGIISKLCYELATPLPGGDAEAAYGAGPSLNLIASSTLLTNGLMLLLRQPLADLLGVPALARYLCLFTMGVLLAGGNSVFN